MKISIYHPSTINSPVTYLSSDIAAGVTIIPVKNPAAFVVNKYACLGYVGFEQAELQLISSVTPPDSLTTGATSYPHNTDDKVTQFDFNQIKIYRSTTGVNGTYSYLDTVNIDVTSDATIYEDATALITYYYKFAYYNSTNLNITDLSDPYSASGFVFYSAKTIVDRVLSLFGDMKSEFVSRDEVMDYINELYERGQQDLAVATKRANIGTPYTFTTVSKVDEYALPPDFLVEKAVKFSKDNGVTFPYSGTVANLDSIGHVHNGNILYTYSIYGNTIKLDPVPDNNSDICKLFYVPVPVTLSLQTDTLMSPFQNSSAMFVKYGLGMCHLKDKKDDWKTFTDKAEADLDKFISFIKRVQNRHPSYSQLVSDRR